MQIRGRGSQHSQPAGQPRNCAVQQSEGSNGNNSISREEGLINQLFFSAREEFLGKCLSERTIALSHPQNNVAKPSSLVQLLHSFLDAIQELPNRIKKQRTIRTVKKKLIDLTTDIQQSRPVSQETIQSLRKSLERIPDQVVQRHGIDRQKLDEVLSFMEVNQNPVLGSNTYLQCDNTEDKSLQDPAQLFNRLRDELFKLYQNLYQPCDTFAATQIIEQLRETEAITFQTHEQLKNQLSQWASNYQQRIAAARYTKPEAQVAFMFERIKDNCPSLAHFALALGLPEVEAMDCDRSVSSRESLIRILQEASKKGLLTDQNVVSALARVSPCKATRNLSEELNIKAEIGKPEYQDSNPYVAGLSDNDTVDTLTASELIRAASVSSIHLAQALGLRPVDVKMVSDTFSRDYRRQKLELIYMARPVTVGKLANIMAHPAVNFAYGIEQLRCFQAGVSPVQQVPLCDAVIILKELNSDEFTKLTDHLQADQPLKRVMPVDDKRREIINRLICSGRLTPGNLLFALQKIQHNDAITRFQSTFPNTESDSKLLPSVRWQPMFSLPDNFSIDSFLNTELMKAIPPTDDWQALAYIMGLPYNEIEDVDYDHAKDSVCTIVALQKILDNNPEKKVWQLISACHQLGCQHLLDYFPSDIRNAYSPDIHDPLFRKEQEDFQKKVTPLLLHRADAWREIGKTLQLGEYKLQEIAYNTRSDREALLKVFSAAKSKSDTGEVNWESLQAYYT
ncbi:hypothetical protein M3P05_07075 [Sansalvadorimonas sp. 2012CJ34-2]|uniref:Uncharacterized protein n=1 Tax=Parendozoicomonas callyspongiae TaxID=2942213 RepID=A0ABT0PEA2_9GAMM|nr:hypothetical protein [Sansalvadorimonas sp. 2012CJ34-2]MCL6269699.1 hypothetical protein [Sansalvadorimonas sp. 2012CJ34-2]